VLAMLSDGATMDSLIDVRRIAEAETGNAEAAIQRLMTEPKGHRRRHGRWHVLATHLRRLNRHIGALAAHVEEGGVRCADAAPVADVLANGLGSAAENIAGGKAGRYEAPENEMLRLRQTLAESAPGGETEGVVQLVGRIASDVGALHAASVGR